MTQHTRSTLPTHALQKLLLLGLLVLAAGCGQPKPDRWEQVDKETRANPGAVVAKSEHGSSFNKHFPQVESPYSLVFKQEKDGFAQALLLKNGKELAMLSVSDTVNNPDAATKYQGSLHKVGVYPIVEIGTDATGALVAERFQVQVQSLDPSLTAAERGEWIQKFGLPGLAALK